MILLGGTHICLRQIILLVLFDSPFGQLVFHLRGQGGEGHADGVCVLVHEHPDTLQLVVGHHPL